MQAEGVQELQVIRKEGSGGRDGVFTLTQGPVSVTVYYSREDPSLLRPEPGAVGPSPQEAEWEKGEVFELWLSHHDGEGDADGPIYGMKDAELAAIHALEYGWRRYVEAQA